MSIVATFNPERLSLQNPEPLSRLQNTEQLSQDLTEPLSQENTVEHDESVFTDLAAPKNGNEIRLEGVAGNIDLQIEHPFDPNWGPVSILP